MSNRISAAALLARLGLGASFLSAVADRLGAYGPPGAPKVVWGDFAHFEAYTAQVNGFAPASLIPALALVATALEILLGVLLILGLLTRWSGAAAGCLLLGFAVAMLVSFGIKPPLDYSVFSAASAGFLLALLGPGAFSLDAVRQR